MLTLDPDSLARLRDSGVSTHHGANFTIAEDCVFEPPCSIKWMHIHHKLRMSAFSYAVSGFYFDVIIGRYVSIGEQVQIGRGSHPISWASTSPLFYQAYKDVLDMELYSNTAPNFNTPIITATSTVIGHDVYIGHGAFVMQGVRIGNGAVVGACSVVTRDVPPYSVVAGSPATVRKMRFTEDVAERMEAVAWWRFSPMDLSGGPVAEPEAWIDFVDSRISEGILPHSPKPIRLLDIVKS